MTHSGLTNQIRLSTQSSSRQGSTIDTVLWHHQAGLNDDATINAMVSWSKEVSANYTISNEGRLTLVVDERLRAHTSGSSSDGGKGAAWDRRAITIEIENESTGPDWRISEAALQTAANLLADLRSRYNIRYIYGHRDLYALYKASYPTYCPGPNTVTRISSRVPGAAASVSAIVSSTPVSDTVDYSYGLTNATQLAIQKGLARLGRYSGDQDGRFGGQSVTALQRMLRDAKILPADYDTDGKPGPVYGEALHDLADQYGYTGTHEGLPGPSVSAALTRWATSLAPTVVQVRPEAPGGRDWSYWEPNGALGKRVQRALKERGRYPGLVDGDFGVLTRKGIQMTLANAGIRGGSVIDGDIQREGSYGIQEYAKRHGSYTGDQDGAPREASYAGFALGLERK